jgi:pyridoxal phosphate enzyme (YggS family)
LRKGQKINTIFLIGNNYGSKKIKEYLNELPENVTLVAVSKTKPEELIIEAYDIGQRIFGENKVQDLALKYEDLPKDILWHMIGHLQTNKVKYIAPFVSLIHAVDSYKLLKEINKEAKKNKRTIDCLFQIYIAKEETKFGLNEEELYEILNSDKFAELENIRIVGLMGMATNTDDTEIVKNEFASLKNLFTELKSSNFKQKEYFKEISMGMSGDYKIAVEQGSTMVRIGSSIFGSRF